MPVKVWPPSVETCHCTSGDGFPVAAAVKLAGWPASTVVAAGSVVIDGAVPTKP